MPARRSRLHAMPSWSGRWASRPRVPGTRSNSSTASLNLASFQSPNCNPRRRESYGCTIRSICPGCIARVVRNHDNVVRLLAYPTPSARYAGRGDSLPTYVTTP